MITCIVQARMGSERLKGKVLKEIIGKPMILHVLDRISKSKMIDKVVLATSTDEINDSLAQCVAEAGYDIFRGSEDNVLERYVQTADKFGGDTIIRVTGDCPLIDAKIVDQVIERFATESLDYLRLDVPETFIRGFDVEIFTKQAMLKTASLADDPKYLEHVTYYIYTHQDQFKVGVERGSNIYNKDYRLCVDNADDFKLVTKIFEHFNDPFICAEKVVKYLDDNPKLAKINSDTHQKNI